MKKIEKVQELTQEEVQEEKLKYTRKIQIPIYEPKNRCPEVSELYDTTKRDELQKEIENEDLPDDLKDFLLSAAERHTSFNFSKIADFYSHVPIKYKKFFENSSLVIIDYDNAVRNGFVSYEKEVDKSRLEYLESLSNEFLAKNKEDVKQKVSKEQEKEIKSKQKELEHLKSLEDDQDW